eukprot:10574168-Ditylum_brightwellii.AAC.1
MVQGAQRQDIGDLCDYFTSHYDTTLGRKNESKSYETIAKDMGLDIKEICFGSDVEEELVMASEAGIGYV